MEIESRYISGLPNRVQLSHKVLSGLPIHLEQSHDLKKSTPPFKTALLNRPAKAKVKLSRSYAGVHSASLAYGSVSGCPPFLYRWHFELYMNLGAPADRFDSFVIL